MTKGADNDNVLSSVVAQSQGDGNWPTYGPGGTALATDPKAHSASSDIEQEPSASQNLNRSPTTRISPVSTSRHRTSRKTLVAHIRRMKASPKAIHR